MSYYLSEIDEGLLDGYVGIIQGLKSADQKVAGALNAFISPVALDQGCIQLLMGLANYEDKPDAVLKSAVGLIGNTCTWHVVSQTRMLTNLYRRCV